MGLTKLKPKISSPFRFGPNTSKPKKPKPSPPLSPHHPSQPHTHYHQPYNSPLMTPKHLTSPLITIPHQTLKSLPKKNTNTQLFFLYKKPHFQHKGLDFWTPKEDQQHRKKSQRKFIKKIHKQKTIFKVFFLLIFGFWGSRRIFDPKF